MSEQESAVLRPCGYDTLEEEHVYDLPRACVGLVRPLEWGCVKWQACREAQDGGHMDEGVMEGFSGAHRRISCCELCKDEGMRSAVELIGCQEMVPCCHDS